MFGSPGLLARKKEPSGSMKTPGTPSSAAKASSNVTLHGWDGGLDDDVEMEHE